MMEEREFTISGIFFAATGVVSIAPNANSEYKKRALAEIKNDEVYSFILSDIPEENRFSSDMYPDYDPVIRQFVCANNLILKKLLLRYSKGDYNEDNPVVQENIYISLPKISKEEYKSYVKVANGKVKRKNEKIKEKEKKKTKLIKERSRYKDN